MRVFRALIGLIGFLFAAILLAQPNPAAASDPYAPVPAGVTAQPAGKIDLVAGDANIIPSGMPTRRAAVGDVVNEGDMLVTGAGSELHLTMADSGFIALHLKWR